MRLFDALSRVVDRQPPSESLLATFGLENSMRSGGVIIVAMILLVCLCVVAEKGASAGGGGLTPSEQIAILA